MKKYLIIIISILFDYNLHIIFSPSNKFLPQIDLVILYLTGLSYHSLSIMILSSLAIVHDILYIMPLGVTSITYILTYIYIAYYKDKILCSSHIYQLVKFVLFILIISFVEWVLISIYSFSFLSFTPFISPSVSTIVFYVLIKRIYIGKYTPNV